MDEQPDYEALCIALYTYRLGTISFLELIELIELTLDLYKTEPLHLDASVNGREGE
jgi:hypothetical protein